MASALRQLPDVAGTEAVDIFFVRNGRSDDVFAHVRGQRQLDEDAMDAGVRVETEDVSQELGFRDGLWKLKQFTLNANLEQDRSSVQASSRLRLPNGEGTDAGRYSPPGQLLASCGHKWLLVKG